MNQTTSCDVLVIGGGPAGSAMATQLARKGRKVILLEKDHHPRFHIGESLLPMSVPYLEALGVADDIERIGLRKYAAEFHSMYHGKQTEFSFGDAIDKAFPYSYQVLRSEFDHILLKNCAANGADVREGCRVTSACVDKGAITSVTAVDETGAESSYQARFYVDATGRDTFLANQMGLKRRNPRHASAALYGHFSGAHRNSGEAEGNIAIYWFDHGWIWFIPLRDGITSIGAVCAPSYLKTRQTPVETFFLDTLALCPDVAKRLNDARLASPVTATGNYSYKSTRMHGKNYLMAGDAFAFIDPVFSGGVHLALHGGFRGAEAIDHILDAPTLTEKALRQYQREISGGLQTFSWFIYRITSPAMRDMFINPRDVLGVKAGMLSLLAGDLFRGTPVRTPLLVFKVIYWIKTLFSLKESREAHRRRRQSMELA